MNTQNQLMSLGGVRHSGLWAPGHEPSLRTLQEWTRRRQIPCCHVGHRRRVVLNDLGKHLLDQCWRRGGDPGRTARLAQLNPRELGLVRSSGILGDAIWHDSARPCERSFRMMLTSGRIPHYRIGRTLFFDIQEVRDSVAINVPALAAA